VIAVDGPDLLRPAEIMAMFGVSEQTLYRWRKKGLIDFTRTPGGQVRYSRAEVEQLLNQSRIPGV
jgi:excisionase family DNA binding protein